MCQLYSKSGRPVTLISCVCKVDGNKVVIGNIEVKNGLGEFRFTEHRLLLNLHKTILSFFTKRLEPDAIN